MAKITSEICVAEIVREFQELDKYVIRRYGASNPNHSASINPKNWKRTSKTGSGITKRIFHNRVTGVDVVIQATENDIRTVKLVH